MNPDLAGIVYSYFFVGAAVLTALGWLLKHLIGKQTEALVSRLERIEYALFNDGQTGLINKVDRLIENQQSIKEDVLVLKVKAGVRKRKSND